MLWSISEFELHKLDGAGNISSFIKQIQNQTMKLAIFLLLTWFTTSLSNLDEPTYRVKRTFSDAQIRETES